MVRRLLLALPLALLVHASPAAALVPFPNPTGITPDGPATLSVDDHRSLSSGHFDGATYLTAVELQVGPGGRAGHLRPRFRGEVVGDWTMVPAAPGTYLLPLTRPVPFDYSDLVDAGTIALDQAEGGQAILTDARYTTYPPGIAVDFDADLDVRAGDPPPGYAGAVTEHQPGVALSAGPVVSDDDDADGVPDDQQRTDLVTTVATGTSTATRRRVVVRVANRGPNATSRAEVQIFVPSGAVLAPRPGGGCPAPPLLHPNAMTCDPGRLAPGSRREVAFDVVTDEATTVHARTFPAGLDLDPATDEVEAPVPAPSALTLAGATRQHLHGGGLHLRATATRSGIYRLRTTVTLGGRRWRTHRSVRLAGHSTASVVLTLPATLRRALAARAGRRGPPATVVLEGGGATRAVRHVRIVP